jgi:hypothetical protein
MLYRYGVVTKRTEITLMGRKGPRSVCRFVHLLWDFREQREALVGCSGDPQVVRDQHLGLAAILESEQDYNEHHAAEVDAARRRRVDAMRRNPRLIPRPMVRRAAPRAVQLMIDFGG